MLQMPVPTKVSVVPLTVQTPSVLEAKVTVRPDVAVADKVSVVPKTCVPGLVKEIVCVCP